MRTRNLFLGLAALVASSRINVPSILTGGTGGRLPSVTVVQGTPGDINPHVTFRLELDDEEAERTQRVAPPRAWTIVLTGESGFIGRVDREAQFHPRMPTTSSTADTGIVIWVSNRPASLPTLTYSRFQDGIWSRPLAVPADNAGSLGQEWWANSRLVFVQASDSFNSGGSTSDDAVGVDQGPVWTISTSMNESNPASVRVWSIFVDSSTFIIPFSGTRLDCEPTLGITHTGESLVPTVTWSHTMSAGNRDPMMVRFVNGAWTPLEPIAVNSLDDRHPRFSQDAAGTVHATWGRDIAESFDEQVLYANQDEGSPTFSLEERVSRSGESAFNPSIAVLPSGEAFIAYESERDEMSPRVVVARRVPRNDHSGYVFRHRVLGRTSSEIPADPELTALGERDLLLTWVETPSRLGFRVFSRGKWAVAGFESIGSDETASDARNRVEISMQGGAELDRSERLRATK